MGWSAVFRAAGLGGIVALAVITFTPLPNALFRWSAIPSDVQAADAIVVLGAAVDPDGTLSPESQLRAIRGIALFREGWSAIVVFSGPSNSGGPTEADVRAALARAMGVPSYAALTESGARTTREEARRIGAMLRTRNVGSILLVTDSQHMRRARALFQREELRVFPATADVRSGSGASPGGRLQLVRDVLGEWLALGYYRVAGYL